MSDLEVGILVWLLFFGFLIFIAALLHIAD